MTKYEELALISGIATITAFSLLIQHVYVTKITENLTYFWIFLNLTGQSLLFAYGKINNIFPERHYYLIRRRICKILCFFTFFPAVNQMHY